MNCNASSHEHANKQMNNNEKWSVREGKLLKYEMSRRIFFRDKCFATLQGKVSFFFFQFSFCYKSCTLLCILYTFLAFIPLKHTRLHIIVADLHGHIGKVSPAPFSSVS